MKEIAQIHPACLPLTVFHLRWRVPLEAGTGLPLEELVNEGQELAQETVHGYTHHTHKEEVHWYFCTNLSANTRKFSAAIFIWAKSSGRKLGVGLAVRDRSAAVGPVEEGGEGRGGEGRGGEGREGGRESCACNIDAI